jgi:hypothetical protein
VFTKPVVPVEPPTTTRPSAPIATSTAGLDPYPAGTATSTGAIPSPEKLGSKLPPSRGRATAPTGLSSADRNQLGPGDHNRSVGLDRHAADRDVRAEPHHFDPIAGEARIERSVSVEPDDWIPGSAASPVAVTTTILPSGVRARSTAARSAHAGLFDLDGEAKPAWRAFQLAVR